MTRIVNVALIMNGRGGDLGGLLGQVAEKQN